MRDPFSDSDSVYIDKCSEVFNEYIVLYEFILNVFEFWVRVFDIVDFLESFYVEFFSSSPYDNGFASDDFGDAPIGLFTEQIVI